MGRDEHNKGKGRNMLMAQTPKNQIRFHDGFDVEFSKEFADADDQEALKRSEAAEKRQKR